MLNELIQKLAYGIDKIEALEDVIELAPDMYENSLRAALVVEDTNDLIENYAGVACSIDQTLPLIFHIIKKVNSWEEGLELNATIGGASSSRGIFISALLSLIYDIPEKYRNLLYYKI